MRDPRILLVDDEPLFSESLRDFLEGEEFGVSWAGNLAQARDMLSKETVDLILLDLSLPDGSGMELLDGWPSARRPPILVLTGESSATTAVEALRRGATDYITKPLVVDDLVRGIRRALRERRREAGEAAPAPRVIPLPSAPMRRLDRALGRIASYDALSVLVVGETGVGKESICRSVHDRSPRAREPFVAVNCADLDGSLARSELFGHERGAFTGAAGRHRGLFETAAGGTLFLDEVTEMPREVQGMFLRALETGAFRRLGGSEEHVADVRVVAATNRPVEELVESGDLREDLYYRLAGIELRIPPLRERPEDIAALADFFCAEAARRLGTRVELSEEVHAALVDRPWPGNVRQLRHAVERSVAFADGPELKAADLRLDPLGTLGLPAVPTREEDFPTLATLEARHMRRALELTDGNRTRAAQLLGVSRSTLVRRLRQGELE